jgi:hypothetical protein
MQTSNSHKPLLGDDIRPLKDFFADSIIVQDYPEHYTVDRNQPRKHHESFLNAKGQGYLYGMRTDNNGAHWTRCVFFKPSELLLQKWSETSEGDQKIESLTIEHMPQSQIMRVEISYMKMMGSKVIGYITENDYKQMKMSTWSKELGDYL